MDIKWKQMGFISDMSNIQIVKEGFMKAQRGSELWWKGA